MHPVLRRIETTTNNAARAATFAGNAFKVGKALWGIGSTFIPPLAAALL
jgi:hypothetical protein